MVAPGRERLGIGGCLDLKYDLSYFPRTATEFCFTQERMNELALFAGAGGGILGGHLLGWRCVCAVEIESYCREVLLRRQRDGVLPLFPIWDDIRTFDGRPWRGRVEVVSGGFPCQDISAAGKGGGIEGERSGLWVEMARVVGEVRPRHVFVENSPMLTSRGLGRVLGDLAALGYDARWGVLGAVDAGAPHRRERIWIVADALGLRELQPQGGEPDERGWAGDRGADVADADEKRWDGRSRMQGTRWRRESKNSGAGMGDATSPRFQAGTCSPQQRPTPQPGQPQRPSGWLSEPDVGRVADGVAHRVDRLKALGNGQVPAVVRLAWETLANPPPASETPSPASPTEQTDPR
jgi:DNA (cytosine-5)-methyltransferase 1